MEDRKDYVPNDDIKSFIKNNRWLGWVNYRTYE